MLRNSGAELGPHHLQLGLGLGLAVKLLLHQLVPLPLEPAELPFELALAHTKSFAT